MMSQLRSPMSPRVANDNTPTTAEKTRTQRFPRPAPFDIHEETENLQSEAQLELKPSIEIRQSPTKTPTKTRNPSKHRSPRKMDQEPAPLLALTEDALRENEGLTRAMDLMNGGDSIVDLYTGHDGASMLGEAAGYPGMDDTCFSTFSAVPNTDMTMFTQMGQSPGRGSSLAKRSREAQYGSAAPTPRPSGRSTPATPRRAVYDECSPSPTPRRPKSVKDADTTNLILDFTEQFNAFSQTSNTYAGQNGRPTPRKFNTQPDLASFAASKRASPTKGASYTPTRAHCLTNLLDFDLPPAPTPRSIPTITARELESLKSSFLSQISSLRATLNGKEAEVGSLKEAVTDAERRVGEALEEIRDERGAKESLRAEKEDWQARDKEMESVLRNVKEEIVHQQHEHEKLKQRLEASEKKQEEAEAKALEAESKIAGMQAASAPFNGHGTPVVGKGGDGGSNAAVEAAVENVARELHGLYKSKHETKVAALKKSYEARWEKKIKDLESRIRDLDSENEELRIARDATMTGLQPPSTAHTALPEVDNKDVEKRGEQAEELSTLKQENATLHRQLEAERLEMAELVRATEEMMQLSLSQPQSQPQDTPQPPQPPPTTTTTTTTTTDREGAAARGGSATKPGTGSERWKAGSFGAGESRIGRMGAGVGAGGTRSGIMSSIERMGRRGNE
ncbi:MAG: hypothetical protein LQ350_005919 [Teloschistes chrysophthalmus]|nr:MAG: hypothetical protein LQ350_005919 [Niorma chrysophthalma]